MIFRRSSVRYGRTPEPETPYQKAAQVWDERLGSARVQAKNWRLMAFGSLFLSAGFAGGLILQSLPGTGVPLGGEGDKVGETETLGAASPRYKPSDPQTARGFPRFIPDG